ncbi:hypothetical protein DFJ67_2847 [Asanoa ferruginea]|uniref:Uncharacterized protein n=1 Tax=Asanoa ferruginea TaxID=53367 RepID=A0A3D9ZJX7_9ACTN|nr:hypothetical protein DFJ67_2847 [Asanoa ferruginea]
MAFAENSFSNDDFLSVADVTNPTEIATDRWWMGGHYG